MILVVNFSGGKDSTAMLAFLCEKYPNVQKRVVFADTGWEHDGTEDWCRQLVARFGLELHTVRNRNKTFLTMAENRGKFPGMQQRQCTSDLKRDPIMTWIRNNVSDAVVVNCMGIRSEESTGRAKQKTLKRNKRETNSVRTVWDWNPIKDWTEAQVLQYLADRDLPLHPVYQHLRRFSCRMCIYMTQHDRDRSPLSIENRLIVSLYDYTGAWAQPYIDAGYPVILWDLKHEGDIIKYWGTLIGEIENAVEAGYIPYGLLAAPPCTDFAVSGAKHFAKKDASTERCGDNDIADNSVDLHVLLVECVLEFMHQVEHFTGHKFKFWVMENPVGRIERLCPSIIPFRKMTFDPCDFGDPYTKKTILWGQFNPDLVRTPVEPEFVIWAGKKFPKLFEGTGGKSEKTKAKRSATPAGFAKAFFNANQ